MGDYTDDMAACGDRAAIAEQARRSAVRSVEGRNQEMLEVHLLSRGSGGQASSLLPGQQGATHVRRQECGWCGRGYRDRRCEL